MKYLILEFKNAKLIRNHNKTKDRYSVFGLQSISRTDMEDLNFIEPITVYQVSNMLHVLMGERPVNTKRACSYSPQQWIYDLALNNTYLKITTDKILLNKKRGIYGYPKESVTINKASWDSWNSGYLNWEIIKEYCGSSFNDFLIELKNIYVDPMSIPFQDIVKDSSECHKTDTRYNTLFNNIKNMKGIGGLIPALKGIAHTINTKTMTTNRRGTALTFTRAVEKAEFYSGYIVVEVTQEILNIIENHYKGTCTILDNGLVNIVDVKDDIPIDFFDGFIKMDKISTDKVKK